MDQGVATLLAALIGATAVLAAALITRSSKHSVIPPGLDHKNDDPRTTIRSKDIVGKPATSDPVRPNQQDQVIKHRGQPDFVIPLLSAVLGAAFEFALIIPVQLPGLPLDDLLFVLIIVMPGLVGYWILGYLYKLIVPRFKYQALHWLIAGCGSPTCVSIFILLAEYGHLHPFIIYLIAAGGTLAGIFWIWSRKNT